MVLVFGVLFGVTASAFSQVQPVASDFEDPFLGLDGWTAFGDTANLRWESEGGNPGGYFAVDDSASGGVVFYSAPPKFLGARAAGAYGQAFSYDLFSTTTNSSFERDDVVLEAADGV